jgi:hypothetical protein
MKKLILTAILSSAATAVFCLYLPPGERLLDNKRVTVTRVTYEPGAPRERYIRPTDQVIVFLDDSEYDRIDSQTKEKTVRKRKSGDAIWHDKGEDAPVLINRLNKPFRTVVIEVK